MTSGPIRPAGRRSSLGACLPGLAARGRAVLGQPVTCGPPLRYHQALAVSGGNGSHSDGITELARYLAVTAPSAPIALDWGMDAPLRYLTGGRVNPVEVFGYASPSSRRTMGSPPACCPSSTTRIMST